MSKKHFRSPAKKADVSSNIPQFQSDQVQSLTFRYILTDAAADVYSHTFELPVYPFGLSTSALSLSCPMKAVRLSKIKLWTVYRNNVGMSGNTHNVTFVDRRGVRPFELSQTASYEKNACFVKKFNKDEPLGWYYSTTAGESNPEITFQLTKGSVLELTFDYVLDDGDIVITASGSGLTTSRIYSNNLNVNWVCIGKTYQYPFVV